MPPVPIRGWSQRKELAWEVGVHPDLSPERLAALREQLEDDIARLSRRLRHLAQDESIRLDQQAIGRVSKPPVPSPQPPAPTPLPRQPHQRIPQPGQVHRPRPLRQDHARDQPRQRRPEFRRDQPQP